MNDQDSAPSISGPLLDLIQTFPHKVRDKIDQCIVNEYTRNQGIAPHIDSPSQFGDTIIGVSLGDKAATP